MLTESNSSRWRLTFLNQGHDVRTQRLTASKTYACWLACVPGHSACQMECVIPCFYRGAALACPAQPLPSLACHQGR
eukprot:scaffold318146_cov50-Prasinocladus_malaysianus.AAC.3